MARTQVYLKVELDLPDTEPDTKPGAKKDKERPERIASEICRMIGRIYGVRSAEVSSIVDKET